MNETGRRELEVMPHDRNGCHATGYEVCFGDVNNPADWWDEFEDKDGNLNYFR